MGKCYVASALLADTCLVMGARVVSPGLTKRPSAPYSPHIWFELGPIQPASRNDSGPVSHHKGGATGSKSTVGLQNRWFELTTRNKSRVAASSPCTMISRTALHLVRHHFTASLGSTVENSNASNCYCKPACSKVVRLAGKLRIGDPSGEAHVQ